MEKISRTELFALLTLSETDRASSNEKTPRAATPEESEKGRQVSGGSQSPVSETDVTHSTGAGSETSVMSTKSTKNIEARPCPQSQERGSWKSESAHVQYLLHKAVPRLWKYAQDRCPSRDTRQLRAKLRELLVWLFTKEGFKAIAQAPAPYRLKGRDVAGRVDVLVSNQAGRVLLALEADWTREEASVQKLRHWNQSGVAAAWIIGAQRDSGELSIWRGFADEVSQSHSSGWLKIVHLEHGLIP